jgi:hypothetical protein
MPMKGQQVGNFYQGNYPRNYNNNFYNNQNFENYQQNQNQGRGGNFQNKNKRPQWQQQEMTPEGQNINIIASMKYVEDNYAHLIKINSNNIGLSENVKAQSNPRFFVIKSFTEEDIHKVI